MSKIIFETEDFNLIPNPSLNEFILGIDIDGMPKLKRANDTIVLGVNQNSIISYQDVTYAEFLNLINTSSLIKGAVYLINNFVTRHYIQFTDTNGDGTSNNEAIYTGNLEQIVLVATSNNTYNSEVKSLSFPNDHIIWKHDLVDREREYVGDGYSRGCIVHRRSESGNSRDYDFRQVKFRRWNDGVGNYTIIRKIDAPNPLDFLDVLSMTETPNLIGFEVGSFNSNYFMDNVILTTTMSLVENVKISKGFNSNIGATLSFSNIDYLENTTISGFFNNNKIGSVIGSTFSGIFNDNDLLTIIDSQLGNVSHNKISILNTVNISTLENNQGITFSNLTLNLVKDNQISFLDSQSGNTNIIGNRIDVYSGNSLSNDVTYNTIHIFQNNTGSGAITYNQGLEWVGNTFNNQVSGNSINYLTSNATMSSISDNFMATMELNYGGTYTGNNGLEFSGNTCSLVIDNQLQYFTNNNGLTVQHNIGYLFTNNFGTSSILSDNIVSEISGNTILTNGLVHNNQGTSIVNNTNYSIVSNTVTEILSNIGYDINHNIGNLIQGNIGLGGTGSINYNNVLVISNTNNFSDIINNQGNIIENNNGATISSNQVVTILNNISSLISENIGSSIIGNTNTILDGNQVIIIDNNIGNFGSLINNNISNTISGNSLFDTIDNNQVSNITSNTTKNITDNQSNKVNNNIGWTNIKNNISQLIENNVINTLIGTSSIIYNNVIEVNNNQDIGTISYNNGNVIKSNYFIDDLSRNNLSNINNNFNLTSLKDNSGINIIGITGSTIGAGPYVGSAALSNTITFAGVDYTSSFNPGDIVILTGATAGTFSVISDLYSSSNTYLTINQFLNVSGAVTVTKIADKLYSIDSVKGTDLKYNQLSNSIIRHTMLDSIEYKSLTPSIPMRFATYSTISRYLIDLDGHFEERANSTGLTWSGPIA